MQFGKHIVQLADLSAFEQGNVLIGQVKDVRKDVRKVEDQVADALHECLIRGKLFEHIMPRLSSAENSP
jgi:hypothetical protein